MCSVAGMGIRSIWRIVPTALIVSVAVASNCATAAEVVHQKQQYAQALFETGLDSTGCNVTGFTVESDDEFVGTGSDPDTSTRLFVRAYVFDLCSGTNAFQAQGFCTNMNFEISSDMKTAKLEASLQLEE